jgi:trimeric autotransporter adhesin
MKRFLMLAAMGFIGLCSTTAHSQSRDIGAERLILDDGAGGTLTIEYAGPGNATLTFPAGGGSLNPNGTVANSTLAWDGSAWVENINLLVDPSGNITASSLASGGYVKAAAGTGLLSAGAILAADLPAGSGSYINNTTTAQATSNFNIDGDGVIGDDLTVGGNINLPATTGGNGQINVAGQRFMHATAGSTFLGINAGNLTQSGNNTAIGSQSLTSATSGSSNVAVGDYSMAATTDGHFNTAVGASSLQSNLSGWNSTAIGHTALLSSTSGSNTAVGAMALRALTTGVYNTAVGEAALAQNLTGYMNVALGLQALLNNGANYSTGVGTYSMRAVTTGASNTGLGAYTDVSNGTFSNATAIGFLAIATASNQMMLGNGSLTQVTTSASINSGAGFRVANAATSGQYLRGNGTNFVSSAILTADLPATITATELKFAAVSNNFAGVVTATNAGGASQSFSNTLVTASSAVIAVLNDADGLNYILSVTPAVGSFTVNFSAAPSADKKVSFIIVNP